jgi:hypothetical protein
MTSKVRIGIALATAALFAVGTAAIAQTTTPDAKPAKKSSLKRHAHKSAIPPASEMYLRAAGSEPAPKAAK